MMFKISFFLALLCTQISVFGQPDFGSSTGELGPIILSLKKPPTYQHHSDCQAIFINYTNVPLQVNRIHPSGRMEKLIYMTALDTVKVSTKTNHHLVVCYQGSQAASMFIPSYDVNIIKIHEKQFNQTKKIPKRMYKPIRSDIQIDKKFKYKVSIKTYGSNGPIVAFDGAHLSKNTKEGLYKPFVNLLEKDGYTVTTLHHNFTAQNLKGIKTLVISNAYGQNINGWLIDSSYALITKEVTVLKEWVKTGGQLLLIADHTPFPGRVSNVAAAFGFKLWDCHVVNKDSAAPAMLFSNGDKTLATHAIMEGRNAAETIDRVATFAGSCMEIPQGAKSIITLSDNHLAIFAKGSQIEQSDYRQSAAGTSQAAIMSYGQGKIAVFCEADMFTALNHKPSKSNIGMNYIYANENPQFILNLFHWMDGFLE